MPPVSESRSTTNETEATTPCTPLPVVSGRVVRPFLVVERFHHLLAIASERIPTLTRGETAAQSSVEGCEFHRLSAVSSALDHREFVRGDSATLVGRDHLSPSDDRSDPTHR